MLPADDRVAAHDDRLAGAPPVPPARRRRAVGHVVGHVVTVLAFLLVYAALVVPNEFTQLSVAAMVRIPLEALVGVLLVLVLPHRARVVLALLAGGLLGFLTVVRALDMGFMRILARHFDPVFDWAQLGNALTFVRSSSGDLGAIAAALGGALLGVGMIVATALAVLRLSTLVSRHRHGTLRVVPVLGAAWLACFAVGAQFVVPVPVASWGTASMAYRTAAQVPWTLGQYQAFLDQAAEPDPFAAVPGTDLLGGLAGKDVVLTFVESYGRAAVENPELAPVIDAVLDDGTRRLEAAGFASRSAFLTSPTAGGGSWLAHATLLSGLWVTNQQSYHTLVDSDRMTLNGAFQRADWDTVGVMPGLTSAWPEEAFYGIDRLYDFRNLGYRGQSFSGFHTPDQYTLSAFERLERSAPDNAPLMAEIPLVTSHFPWVPVPPSLPWDSVGDGSIYDTLPVTDESMEAVWSDPVKIRAQYARSIGYSLESVISYVETHGDDDLVLVFLGDHQPAPIVTGEQGGRDVPITIVAKDPAVLDQVAGWDWDAGLNPGPAAPVWRMDDFRDKFLTTFSR
ncbi:sulfatase [Pseudonocardia lacus]|uniref:sulfatase n=1 Tax=Pseudonocardia lacus TaxID=2835865 RepID=UPI0027E22D23|nr:sulfatase [Pseudonocardia lacus]